MGVEVVGRAQPEDAALPARVGGLEDGGKADRLGRSARLGVRADGREAGLRNAVLGEPPPHRDLVRHHVRGVGADPGQPERLGDGRDDRHRPVGRDGHYAVDFVPAADLGDGGRVAEVDHLRLVRECEPRRVGVPVDRDDTRAQLARTLDRAPLVASRADEEDRAPHGGRCY